MWKKYLVCMSTFCIISLLCACTNGKVIHPALENTSSTISSEDSIDETVEKPSDAFSSPTDSEQSSNTVDIREIIYLQLPVEKQSMLSPIGKMLKFIPLFLVKVWDTTLTAAILISKYI